MGLSYEHSAFSDKNSPLLRSDLYFRANRGYKIEREYSFQYPEKAAEV